MYRFILLFVSVLCVTHLSGQTPVHSWELNNSYADVFGGNAMVPNGGTLTSTSYLFEKGEGPHVSNSIDPNTYSIVMRFTQHYVGSWAKILDFKNRTVDGGVYITGGGFYFSNSDYSISGFWPMEFMQDVPLIVCITRNGTTKEVRGYVDGTLGWSFEDINDEATFTGPGNIIQVLIDNDPGLGEENTNGSLDYFKIYNYVVTDLAIINPSCGNSDSDCDGISNSCDVCPGGDDHGPCNATTLPPLSIFPANWLCSNNNNSEKILICHQGTTMCVSENSANTHLAHGDFLGPCSSCSQNYTGEMINDEPFEGAVTEGVMKLFPNPTSDEFILRIEPSEEFKVAVRITDILGKTWETVITVDPEIYLGQHLPPGIYYAELIRGEERKVIRLMKTN
ncbi:MAG: T9SS type A sorting domain-containing protein [Saprospiraceae bacterium]